MGSCNEKKAKTILKSNCSQRLENNRQDSQWLHDGTTPGGQLSPDCLHPLKAKPYYLKHLIAAMTRQNFSLKEHDLEMKNVMLS